MPHIGKNQERWILMGASSGLGFSFAEIVAKEKKADSLFLMSRRSSAIEISDQVNLSKMDFDFSVKEVWPEVTHQFLKFDPTRIFYFAGGGPFGEFATKSWKDHEWALRVSYEAPAFFLHQAMTLLPNLKQFVLVGSAIADSKVDPMAASYSAGKHALRGLVSTVQSEIAKSSGTLDLRLFRPGYMDTRMLPAHAWPRQRQGLVRAPAEAAKALLDWVENLDDANSQLEWP